jgi:hypothetical protein
LFVLFDITKMVGPCAAETAELQAVLPLLFSFDMIL